MYIIIHLDFVLPIYHSSKILHKLPPASTSHDRCMWF